MRHPDRWVPTKFVLHKGRWRGSRDPRELAAGSRLIADLVAREYERNLPAHASGKLLDLGCGKAPLYGMLHALVDEVRCADRPGSLHGNLHVDVFLDLERPLPFADGRFQTVLLSDVLEHAYRPRFLWREMNRILKPGGKVVGNTPFYYWIHEAPHDYFRFTEYSLARMSGDAGFRVLVLNPLGGPLSVIADIAAKRLAAIPVLGGHLAAALQASIPRRVTVAGDPPSRQQERTAYPLGYFFVVEKVREPDRGVND